MTDETQDAVTPEQVSGEGAASEQDTSTVVEEQAAQAAEDGADGATTEQASAKEDQTETPADGLEIAVPEGMDQFQEDIQGFSKDMQAWMMANPEASVADALQEAANRQARVAAELMQAQKDQYETQVKEWDTAARSDKEYGGDNFDANVALAKKALEAFGNDELTQILDASGLGSHPEVIRAFVKVGRTIQESDVVGDTMSPASSDSGMRARYPTSAK